jgi:asparagine synthase (glutamine-hydrolysing)
MCGITGFITHENIEANIILDRMITSLKHRGPDGNGIKSFLINNTLIGLAHSRLSIIDLNIAASQPMTFKNYSIVFNGEIYNFAVLKQRLIKLGRNFKTYSDTEVILQSIDEWGLEAVNEFVGMFAFVLFDESKNKLYLFRDRVGVKPLYYYIKNNTFLFASEIKAFFHFPSFIKKINFDALAIFLQKGYISGNISIYENIKKVNPGSYIEINVSNLEFKEIKYWNIKSFFTAKKNKINIIEAQNEVEKILLDSCKFRMVSDVPVGVFLSGGYDSTTVTALLQKSTNQQIKTFTIGFEEKKYDESFYAKKVANYLGTDHNEYIFTKKELLDNLFNLYNFFDEPFADISALPTLILSKIAKEKVTVALSSDGGDEAFGGYTKYSHLLNFTNYFKINTKSRAFFSHLLLGLNPKKIPFLNKSYNFETRYVKGLNLLKSTNLIDAYDSIGNVFTINEVQNLVNHKFPLIEDLQLNQIIEDLDKLLYSDYNSYLVDDVLVKVDRTSMSMGLEGREPLLDHRLIEFVASLPANYKIHNGNKKYLLKNICHKYLPKELMDRNKMGFGIPIVEWFEHEIFDMISCYLSEDYIKNQKIFNFVAIENLIKNYQINKSNNIFKIWNLLSFQFWYEKIHKGYIIND